MKLRYALHSLGFLLLGFLSCLFFGGAFAKDGIAVRVPEV